MKSGPTNLLIAIALFVATPSMASEIVGTATVVDGDTIEIQGQRIRLHGIDAPERGQLCKRNGSLYRCGQAAALALADMVGQAVIRCQPNGVDRYKRIIGVCFKADQDLNRWMVRNGWAVAYRRYSQDYVPDELTATATRIGVWSGTFEMPWEWRKKHR